MAEGQDGKGKFSISGLLTQTFSDAAQSFSKTKAGRTLTAAFNSKPVSAVRHSFNAVAGVYKSTPVRAIRAYLWPFRVTKAVWAQRMIIPVILAHQLIQTPTVYLFPKAENYLQDQGISASVAKELSDRDIRVRERNLLGTLHSYNDLPTVFGIMRGAATLLEPAQAYAHPDFATRLLGQCPVTLADPNLTARHALAALGGLTEQEAAQIENIPLTDKEARTAIEFHEFRHCDTQNAVVDSVKEHYNKMETLEAAANHAESDADLHGYTVASRVFHNPEIGRAFLYARALNKNVEAHDTSLYLDAGLNGEPLPRELDALQATQDVFSQLEIYQRLHTPAPSIAIPALDLDGTNADPTAGIEKMLSDMINKNQRIQDAIDLQHIVADHPDMFSDLAKHRAQLYIDAVKYFYPTQYTSETASAKIGATTPSLTKPPVLHFTF